MKYSVILPTHLRDHSALQALDSVLKQNYEIHEYEVLIIANPHSEFLERQTSLRAQKGRPVRYLQSAVGVNIAKNLGVCEARGEVVVFLDDDCLWSNTTHLLQLDKMYSDSRVGGVGGFYQDPYVGNTVFISAFNLMSNLWLKKYIDEGGRTSQFLGGHSSYRREVFRNLQFDESIPYGGDEVGLHAKLSKRGVILRIDEKLQVQHAAYGGWSTFIQRALKHGQNKKKFSSPAGHSWPLVEMAKAFLAQPGLFVVASMYWTFQQAAFLWQNREN